ncbi:MAG: metallophosphoesterase [Eubacteriales bacterium]
MTDRLDITAYTVENAHLAEPVRLALVTDMHNRSPEAVLSAIRLQKPDAVVIAGDQMTDTGRNGGNALMFLEETAKAFPVFYGLGNHERFLKDEDFRRIRGTGAVLLINDSVRFGELCIGAPAPETADSDGNRAFLERFCREDGYRVLLSHRPEWYPVYLRELDIPLILSGHAHGGQIRLFGHPVYSPGQGLFPKYAQGMHEGRLIVSRGLGNHTIVPRFGNRPELCMVTIR